jgi:hypothetical protein
MPVKQSRPRTTKVATTTIQEVPEVTPSEDPKYKVVYKTGSLTLEKFFMTNEEADIEVDKINSSGSLRFMKKVEL